MKQFLFCLLLATSLFSCKRGEQKKNGRPNVIVILVDDMGYSDIGCYGSEIETPNIDKLGYNGLRFTQFYNAARCCPSRVALLTGLYPHQGGMGDMVTAHHGDRTPGAYQGWLSQNAVTIAEVLKAQGYNTYMSGKWHVGEDSVDWPLQRGFDKYFGLISGANSYFEILPGRKMVSQNTLLTKLPDDFYMTDALTDSAVNFVKQGDKGNPFFLYLAYTAPHWPLHAVKEKIEKYRGKYMVGWDSIRQARYKKQNQLGLFTSNIELSPRDKVVPAWSDASDKETWDLKMAVYAAMMESVDDGIGKIVKTLEESGQLDNTVIMFMSDNGGCHETLEGRMDVDLKEQAKAARTKPAGNKGSYTTYSKEWAHASNTPFRRYKKWTHEGGISTPFIIHFPKIIPQGRIIHETSHLVDIMPTLTELCGAAYPKAFGTFEIQPAEGKSLLPLIMGAEWKGHDYLFWEHEASRAVRYGKWKLVSEPDSPWELYDMDKDRSELNNLAASLPDTVTKLEAQYALWASRVGVQADRK